MNNFYTYTIIRKDIPIADQMVQVCHSSYHAGNKFGTIELDYVPNMVLLEVKNKEELITLINKLGSKDIRSYAFYEPDDDLGLTAITTEPLEADGEKRKAFSNTRLWRA